jgi:hypothetical protein
VAGGNKRQDQTLHQALLELAQEEVQALKTELDQRPVFRHQVDALYHRNRQDVAAYMRKRLRRHGKRVWRYVALAASLVLVMLGAYQLSRPPKDTVSLSQPPCGFGSSTPGVFQTPATSISPSIEPATVPPLTASSAMPSALPTPDPSPIPTIEPTQAAQTPVPELSPKPRWSGKYFPRLPETYRLDRVDTDAYHAAAMFLREDGRQLLFTEYQGTAVPTFNEASSFSYHALADGTTALLVQSADGRTLVWDRGGQTFSIKSAEETVQLLMYADSVALSSSLGLDTGH